MNTGRLAVDKGALSCYPVIVLPRYCCYTRGVVLLPGHGLTPVSLLHTGRCLVFLSLSSTSIVALSVDQTTVGSLFTRYIVAPYALHLSQLLVSVDYNAAVVTGSPQTSLVSYGFKPFALNCVDEIALERRQKSLCMTWVCSSCHAVFSASPT